MNRCLNTGLGRNKPFLNPSAFSNLREEIDAFIDRQIEK